MCFDYYINYFCVFFVFSFFSLKKYFFKNQKWTFLKCPKTNFQKRIQNLFFIDFE